MDAEPPFRPRLRPRAFLRMLRPRHLPGGPDVLAWSSAIVGVFCLWRLVVVLRGLRPDDGQSGALAAGGSGTTWLVLATGAFAILAYALHRSRMPAAWLKPGGLKAMLAAMRKRQ